MALTRSIMIDLFSISLSMACLSLSVSRICETNYILELCLVIEENKFLNIIRYIML